MRGVRETNNETANRLRSRGGSTHPSNGALRAFMFRGWGSYYDIVSTNIRGNEVIKIMKSQIGAKDI